MVKNFLDLYYDMTRGVFVEDDPSTYLSSNPESKMVVVSLLSTDPLTSGIGLDSQDITPIIRQGGEVYQLAIDEGQLTVTSTSSGSLPKSYLPISGGQILGNLSISGDLSVAGTSTELNTQELLIEDNLITLNSNVSGNPVLDAGIEVERGSELNSSVFWDESREEWRAGVLGSLERIILQSDLVNSSGVLQSQINSNDIDITQLQSTINTTSGNLQSDIDSRVLRSGDTLSGFLTLHSDPTSSGHAATKQYVDVEIFTISGTLQDKLDTLEFNQDTSEAYVDTSTSTTSATFVPLAGMSITPTSGTHYISFSAGMELSNSNSQADYAIYVGSTPVSERTLRPKSNGRFPVHVQKVVSVNGTQPVTLQYRISAGSLTVYTRNLISTKISS